MMDPLTSIDAETLEKQVNDCYKTMHKSAKIFQQIPGTYILQSSVSVYFLNENVSDINCLHV